MKKVWTPNGYQVGPMNSLVGKGESIINYSNGTGSLVTKGTKGVDNQPSSVQPNDDNVIAGNDIDWSNGMKFSDQIAPLTKKLEMYNSIENKNKFKPNLSSLSKQTKQLQDQQLKLAKQPILNAMKNITDRQEMQHNIEKEYGYKPMYSRGKSSFSSYSSYTGSGKVPKYDLLASRLGPALTEMTMLNHWLKNKPGSTDIYAANPYETQALSTMASNRVTPYPALQAINLENRKGIYNINQSGGYSGGQRQNARVAQNIGAQRNAANALLQAQDQNAKYRDQWAQAALSAGAQDAQRRQAANQYNWEAYNKAHGAKTKGIETHLANLGAMWQKYWADRIKNKQYEDILNIYQQDVDNKKDALKTIYGTGSDSNSKSATGNTGSTNNFYTRQTKQPYEMNLYQRSIQPQQNWQDKVTQIIENLPLPDLPYQHTNYLDTIDWAKYFDAQKKYNKIITGKNGIPKSSQYTYYGKNSSSQYNYLGNLIPQLIPTLPDTSKYMQEYQKRMGMPMDKLRSNYNKYLGGDIFVDSDEPLGFTRMSAPGNKNIINEYGFPINRDQMIRGLMLYNPDFKVPSIK